jgi:hypothetical protein
MTARLERLQMAVIKSRITHENISHQHKIPPTNYRERGKILSAAGWDGYRIKQFKN